MRARSNHHRSTRPDGRHGPGIAVKVALAVTALLTTVLVGAIGNPFAAAQKVGNPGPLNMKIVGGQIILGTQSFDLTPNPLPQCSDGINNDDAQDALIDYPADPQCSSADDDSEIASGFQPKQDVTISGTVAGDGTVNVPQSGIFFPPVYQYSNDAVLTVTIAATSAGTGNVNPLTGVASLSISLRIQLQGSPSGVSLGGSCYIGPFTIGMNTGTTNPPAPNTPITGVPYSPDDGTATLVNNAFSVPGASGCGPLGLANGQINDALGIPSAAGRNTAVLEVQGTPIITRGVNASIVPSVTSGAAPLIVNFNGTGSTAAKPIASYAWDFGNGQTATGSTASTTYTAPGSYTASLTVTDTDGDSNTKTVGITVTEPANVAPTAVIGSSGTGGNAPYALSVDGSASSDPDGSITGYSWDFGDGSAAVVGVTAAHTYTAPGNYTVTLTVTDDDGATGTATKAITVTPPPNVPPTAIAKVLSASGTIPLTVTLSGATSSDSDGTIVSYDWDLGDGSPVVSGVNQTHTYTAAGSYDAVLTVTDDDGATGTSTVTIEVSADPNIAPTAEITSDVSAGTAPLTVNFDGTGSSDLDGTIAAYSWNFGNGQNSGAATASATYAVPGTYTATLTVTDNKGATGTATKQIVVSRPPNQPPVAAVAATPASGTAPLLVQFSSAGSSDADGAITGYSWTFGNGQTATSANPAAAYNAAGTYVATLTVTDNDGATAAKSVTVTVTAPNQPPVPVIGASSISGAAPFTVNLNGAGSSDADGSIVSYAWNFGNGQTGTGATTSVTYNTPGSYQIKLTVTDNAGAARATTITVVAGATNQKPVAVVSALPTSGPAPLTVQLSSLGSNDPDGTIVSYAWDFGNGQTATGTATQVVYASPGTYVVTLKVTDNKGAVGTATEQIVVDPPQAITDRIRLQFAGALTGAYDGPINGGNLRVLTDTFGVLTVDGTATYGAGNSIQVNLSRFLWFNAFNGTMNVDQPGSGINSVTTYMWFGPLSRPSATSVRGSVQASDYVLNFTIDDRAP